MLGIGLPLAFAGSCAQEETPPERPNILFMITDQQNLRAVGAHGNPHLETPSLDYLANTGISFFKSCCTSPVSGPSRSSLVTSRMPHETGMKYNGQTPTTDIPNMGELFSSNGYRTVWGGKWHLPEAQPLRAKSRNRNIRGFEVLHYYDSTKNWPEWGRGAIIDEPLGHAAADFLRSYDDDKPFLLCVSFVNPHDICYHPRKPGEHPNPGSAEELPPLPHNHEINDLEPEFYDICRQRPYYGDELLMAQEYTEQEWRGYLYHYHRYTNMVDRAIGLVLEGLKESGLEENTLVIFTSDHGDGATSHAWAAKLSLYQESVAVPLIINWKGVIPHRGTNRKHVVSGLDVLPTLLDYAGIGVQEKMHGLSLRKIIENPHTEWREYAVTELAPDPRDESFAGRMVRTRQYKYNLFSTGEMNEELFDLLHDPGETMNLACEPSMQEIKSRHRKMLEEWIEKTDDDFMVIKE